MFHVPREAGTASRREGTSSDAGPGGTAPRARRQGQGLWTWPQSISVGPERDQGSPSARSPRPDERVRGPPWGRTLPLVQLDDMGGETSAVHPPASPGTGRKCRSEDNRCRTAPGVAGERCRAGTRGPGRSPPRTPQFRWERRPGSWCGSVRRAHPGSLCGQTLPVAEGGVTAAVSLFRNKLTML